jgi:predicted short-subunit dehydrogenase-like oxidoreductase (DUF2520 family)
MARFNISFAGAGKVAGALCTELSAAGHKIIQITSKVETRGKVLASSVNAIWSDKLEFASENNIIIVSVPDSELTDVLRNIKCNPDTYIVHTAGSYGLEVFPDEIRNKGVFYPLQTFSKERKSDFRRIPLIIEANSENVKNALVGLASALGSPVYFYDAEKRRILHMAAVFASNFTNFMLTNAKEITDSAKLPFDLLAPLVTETVTRAFEIDPAASQTGPAIRNDLNTIEIHAKLLESSPEIKELYLQITSAIIKYYKNNRNG